MQYDIIINAIRIDCGILVLFKLLFDFTIITFYNVFMLTIRLGFFYV